MNALIAMPTVDPPHSAPLARVWVAGNPVSSNHMYGVRGGSGSGYAAAKRLTPEARAWRDAVATMILPYRFAEDAPRPALGIACVFLGGVRADVDNLLKLVVDGVKLGLAVDDRYVLRVSAEKIPLARGAGREKAEKGAWIEVTQLPTPEKPKRAPRPLKAHPRGVRKQRTA